MSNWHQKKSQPSICSSLLLAVALSTPFLEAQTSSIPFARLSLEEGLSQGTVNCVLQDRAGFMWIGTQGGLNRYDGYGFEVYKNDPADPSSLPANWIEALALGPSGDLWIATQGGLARRRDTGESFERLQHDAGDPNSHVRALAFDRSGDLWIGRFQGGLVRLDAGSGRLERFRHDPDDPQSLADDRVRTIYEDRSGQLWIGTLSGLDAFDPTTRSFRHLRHDPADAASLSDDRVTAILEDSSGVLWVGTENGLNRRDGTGFVRVTSATADPALLSHNLVWALFEDDRRRLWVGTDHGLNLLHDGVFARYVHDGADPRSLSSNRVTTLYQDRGGVLWVGTQGGGLNKWNPITWSFVHHRANPEGLTSNAVFAFSEDRKGRLWVGTFGGGLNVLEDRRFRSYRHDPANPASLASDQVSALEHDGDGVLWVGTAAHGVDRFDAATETFRHFRHDPTDPTSLSDDAVTALFVDRRATLWAATFRAGLNRFVAETGSFEHYRHHSERLESLSGNSLTALAEDADGFLWIGTFGSGLNRLEPAHPGGSQRMRHDPDRPSSLSNDMVYALHIDADGVLWVGTQVGLDKLEGLEPVASFRSFSKRDGLASDVVYGIRSDAAGQLWLATDNGLSRFDPAAETFKTYNASHGLQSNEFNFGAHYRSRDGRLFFGGVNGFNAFDPEHVESNTAVPPVVLTSFALLNEEIPLGVLLADPGGIALSYRDDLFSFEFAALDYTTPAENLYRYQVEGLSDTWIDLDHRRQVTFTDLAPGRYVLRVQGSNNDGVWNEEGAALRIFIRPPFWETWWFRLTVLLAVAVALLIFHHERMEQAREQQKQLAAREKAAERELLIAQLEAKNAELNSFTHTVSHDLKSPLVTIRGFLGQLRQDAAKGRQEHLERDIDYIDDAARKMTVLLEDLLALSRSGQLVRPPEEVPLREIVDEALALVAGEIEIGRVRVEVAADLPAVYADRSRLTEMLQNMIQNAVKYMGEQRSPRIEIGLRREGRKHVFFIRDNGIGIASQDQHQVFGLFQRVATETEGTGVGLALVQRIVEAHDGRVWVESEGEGRGSTFCFTLWDNEGQSPGARHSTHTRP